MGSSTAGVTVTDDSAAAISDEDGATTDTDVDVKGAVDSSLPSDPSPFSQGEKVLAFFQNHVYPAKVQKVDVRLKEWRFYVHYLGWKKSWDEWVSMDRLMKFTEENVQKQVVFNKKKSTEKITKTGEVVFLVSCDLNTFAVARGKKRKIDSVEKLVRLPRNPNVDDILKKYLDHRLKKDGAIADSIEEILNGLRCYFDKALPAMLLYKSERQQYQDATADHVSPSTVYGAEHLLRLFVKLPEMLYYANIEEETLKELQQKLLDFLKFLQKNQSSFFLSTYQTLESSDACTKKQDD
ncbi:protein MRG1-like isoform X3 [Rhododendron vialii]|uniref:protein MRG1-like isoform X3 n=1 Tax=Rhododendron vialii TaxID=182163 RepID=UPI00265F80AD|nr:protein MRG1-like isoform X3 [Rhododendron vialii]